MEDFRIDFTLSNPFPDGCRLGECGEKNAAQLIITPPENLASREEIRSYVVAFSTEKGPVRFGPFPKAEFLNVPVGSALTVGTALSVQLEGFDADGEFVIKSPVLSGITVSSSIRDCSSCDGSENDGGIIPGHMHQNLDVLDSLADENGVLTYKGNSVSSGGTVKTVVLPSNTFILPTDIPNTGILHVIALNNDEGEPYVPEGAQILSVEYKIISEDSVWTDIRDMIKYGYHYPYVINQHKSYYSENFGGIVTATVTFINEMKNEFFDAAANYQIDAIRIKYIAESEEEE